MRASQDDRLPDVYNGIVINNLFKEMADMDFFALALSIKALRIYVEEELDKAHKT